MYGPAVAARGARPPHHPLPLTLALTLTLTGITLAEYYRDMGKNIAMVRPPQITLP